MSDFLAIQTQTGWGRTLQSLVEWCQPQPGWSCLDVGCGPGLLPALLACHGCHAWGVDHDWTMFHPVPLHPQVLQAEAAALPFLPGSFDLVTASNLLFLLADPQPALLEMKRVLRATGQLVLLNPSEYLTQQSAAELANRLSLEGLARSSLLDWARRAERHARWSATDLEVLLAAAGFRLVETGLKMGPGLARLARGIPLTYAD